MFHAWERREMHTKFWPENLKGRNHAGNMGIDGSLILQWNLGKYVEMLLSGFIWLRIGADIRLL
jgi:hypothetical protein